jgi:TetR/AcrR family fatty acid metabolism transcriptional regulator
LEKVEAILKASTDLFAEKGFEHTPVSEIAKRAKVAGGTIIYHFKSKENLLRILTRQTLTGLFNQARKEIPESGTSLEKVEAFINSYFDYLRENPKECLVLFKNSPFEKLVELSDGPGTDIKAVYQRYSGILHELIEEGISKGEIREVPVRDTAMNILATLIGSAWLTLFFNESSDHLAKSAVDRAMVVLSK